MPFPPYPSTPQPFTWTKGQPLQAPWLRNDVFNALLLLTQPPVFSGAQTGVPVAFTVAAGQPFTAAGTAYPLGQPVIFTSTGSGFPSSLTQGQVYYVYNPAGTTFQISTTQGATSPYTSYGSGSGTVQSTQLITQNAWTPVNLDTELNDAWAGHQDTSNPPYYYGMFPGWYLADLIFPANVTNNGSAVSAGLLTQEGTGTVATIGGQCGKMSQTSGRYASSSVTRLVQLSVTGTYAGPQNNYVAAAAWQDSPGAITALATATRFAQMNLEWVAALSGNAMLPVPDNDTWPAPPQMLTSTFVNKNVRDTIGFLAYRPVMEAYYNAGTFSLASQSSEPATGTTIPLDSVHADTRSAFNTGTSTWTCPVPGIYDVYAQVPVKASSSSVSAAAGFTLTSANYNSGTAFTIWGPIQAALTSTGEVNCAVMRRRVRLNRGDTIKLAGYQNSSGSSAATVPSGTWQARLITVWRGKTGPLAAPAGYPSFYPLTYPA